MQVANVPELHLMPVFRFLCVGLVVVLAILVPIARAQAVDGGHARVELVSDRAVCCPRRKRYGWGFPSRSIRNGISIGKMPVTQASRQRSFGAVKASILLKLLGPFEWPIPELLPVVPGEIMDYGYSDQVVLPFPVTIPAGADGAILFEGVADYLICEDVCIPESAPIRLLLSIGSQQVPDERGAGLIDAAMEDVPPKFSGETTVSQSNGSWILSVAGPQVAGLSGDARFFPEGHEIVHAADQVASFGTDGLQLTLTPSKPDAPPPDVLSGIIQIGEVAVDIDAVPGAVIAGTSGRTGVNLPLLIMLALIGGLILNLMPCVLPVLSIKAMGVVAAAASGDTGQVRAHGLWYTAGILLSFAILAVAIVAVRTATGFATWGFWMQDPVVITVLVLVVFLIGLWLLGVFELGRSVQNVGEGLARKQGSMGAFFTGVLAVVVGAPCTGPFLGAALGGIMGQPPVQVFAVLLAMGLGLALPFLLLSFMPSLQRLMPRPGAWMVTLKQVFAFPMFLTAAYFLWTLGDLAGTMSVAAVVAGAVLLAFWCVGLEPG